MNVTKANLGTILQLQLNICTLSFSGETEFFFYISRVEITAKIVFCFLTCGLSFLIRFSSKHLRNFFFFTDSYVLSVPIVALT